MLCKLASIGRTKVCVATITLLIRWANLKSFIKSTLLFAVQRKLLKLREACLQPSRPSVKLHLLLPKSRRLAEVHHRQDGRLQRYIASIISSLGLWLEMELTTFLGYTYLARGAASSGNSRMLQQAQRLYLHCSELLEETVCEDHCKDLSSLRMVQLAPLQEQP